MVSCRPDLQFCVANVLRKVAYGRLCWVVGRRLISYCCALIAFRLRRSELGVGQPAIWSPIPHSPLLKFEYARMTEFRRNSSNMTFVHFLADAAAR
jgi:hypothetical protein